MNPVSSSSLLPTPAALEALLHEAVGDLVPRGRGPGRPAVLPAAALWGALTIGVLAGDLSQVELWRRITDETWWYQGQVQISKEAVYHRLDRPGPSPMQGFFQAVTQVLLARRPVVPGCDLAPFAREVVALDESTLDAVARTLPSLREVPPGAKTLLPGKLTGVFDLRRQLFRSITVQETGTQNEKVAARAAIADLPPGSLILSDLGYFSFAWFDHLTESGQYWISKYRAKTSSEEIQVITDHGTTRDAIVWLGKHRADRAKYRVRLIQFEQQGQLRAYLTNVLDPALLSIGEVAALYARRWDIELAYKLAKTHLKLHVLWSAKPQVIAHQVWAVLLIAQLVLAARAEVADRAGLTDVFEVSVPLLVHYLPQYALRSTDPIGVFVDQGRRLGFIRPSRRTVIVAPTIPPEQIEPPPIGPFPPRIPRYAGKA